MSHTVLQGPGSGGIEISAGDDAAWTEVRRKAVAVAETLAHAPPTVRLSMAEAARVLGVPARLHSGGASTRSSTLRSIWLVPQGRRSVSRQHTRDADTRTPDDFGLAVIYQRGATYGSYAPRERRAGPIGIVVLPRAGRSVSERSGEFVA